MPELEQLLALSKDALMISLAISFGCAVLCALIAARRKARVGYWSAMGFIFGPFALPFVLMAKPAEKKIP